MSAPATPVDYQSLFHSLPENFLLMTPDATIIDNSDAHVAISLKTREEVVGKAFFEAFPVGSKNEGDIIAQSHENVRRTLQPDAMPLIRYDLQLPTAQGGGFEEMYWQATHYPILDAQGQLQYILQRTQNVTEQHRAALAAAAAQQALAESQERTRFILESLPVMVWTNTPEGKPDYFNARWLYFFDKTADELMAWDWQDSTHPDDRAGLTTGWQQALATGTEFQHEYRLRRHDGQYRWLLIRSVPRRDETGRIIMWVGVGTDIHEQRQMVQELLEANEQQASLSEQAYQLFQKTEAQRETYYNLFMQAPALICILRGPEHRYDFVNPPYQQLFANRQLLGRTVAEALPEMVPQGIVELLDHVYETGETFHGSEVELYLIDGTSDEQRLGYFNFTYQQFSEQEQTAGIMVFAFDVTDLVLARQALEQLRDNDATSAAGLLPGE